MYIIETKLNKPYIIYRYNDSSLVSIISINKLYKNIYLINDPREIHTNKFSCAYYNPIPIKPIKPIKPIESIESINPIKYIKVKYSEKQTNTTIDCLLLYKELTYNSIKYIYRKSGEIYAYIIKYKSNNLIYKKNVKFRKNKSQLILLNKLFIHFNFSYSYNIYYLL